MPKLYSNKADWKQEVVAEVVRGIYDFARGRSSHAGGIAEYLKGGGALPTDTNQSRYYLLGVEVAQSLRTIIDEGSVPGLTADEFGYLLAGTEKNVGTIAGDVVSVVTGGLGDAGTVGDESSDFMSFINALRGE